MIVSNKFVRSNYGKALREFLATKTTLLELIDFGELPVFQDAAAMPVIIITQNRPTQTQRFLYAPIKRLDFDSLNQEAQRQGAQLDERALRGANWTLTSDVSQSVIQKMTKKGVPLWEYTQEKILFGIKTGYVKAFLIDRATKNQLMAQDSKSGEVIKPYILGDDVRKYNINLRDRFLIVIPKGWTREKSKGARNPWGWFQKTYPALANHLKSFEGALRKRQDQGEYWWELRACDYYGEFHKPKIVYPDIAKESRFAFDTQKHYPADTIFTIPMNDLYLLGLLNSKISFFYLKRTCPVLGDPEKGGRLRLKIVYIKQLPIRRINFADPAEKKQHDETVARVSEMLELQKEYVAAAREKFADKMGALKRRIDAVDRAIDAIVYRLYDLSAEEIAIVENKV